MQDHILHPYVMPFEQVQPSLDVCQFESTQQACPQVAERVGDFRIEPPGTDLNDRLCQQITNIGGRLRCCELLQSIRAVYCSTAAALAAKFLGPARLCVQRTMLFGRERRCLALLTISLPLLALHR